MTSTELTNYGSQLPALHAPIADKGDKRTPISGSDNNTDRQASLKFGLPALMSEPLDENGIPVPRQDLNGIYNLLSKITHYLMAGGYIPYLDSVSTAIGGYPKGAKISYDGNIYKSLVDSNTSIPTDSRKWELITYLPLKGGNMGGSITFDKDIHFAKGLTDDNCLSLCGGTSLSNGAAIRLAGKDYSGTAAPSGCFELQTAYYNNSPNVLQGNTDGSLKWNGRNIVRSVNGVNAGINGNVNFAIYPGANLYSVNIRDLIIEQGKFHTVWTATQNCYFSIYVRINDLPPEISVYINSYKCSSIIDSLISEKQEFSYCAFAKKGDVIKLKNESSKNADKLLYGFCANGLRS